MFTWSPIDNEVQLLIMTGSGGWSTWSSCSKDCGTGKSVRMRFMEPGNRAGGQILNWKKCNTQPCTPEGNIEGQFMSHNIIVASAIHKIYISRAHTYTVHNIRTTYVYVCT